MIRPASTLVGDKRSRRDIPDAAGKALINLKRRTILRSWPSSRNRWKVISNVLFPRSTDAWIQRRRLRSISRLFGFFASPVIRNCTASLNLGAVVTLLFEKCSVMTSRKCTGLTPACIFCRLCISSYGDVKRWCREERQAAKKPWNVGDPSLLRISGLAGCVGELYGVVLASFDAWDSGNAGSAGLTHSAEAIHRSIKSPLSAALTSCATQQWSLKTRERANTPEWALNTQVLRNGNSVRPVDEVHIPH